ncbi:hypothetical protein KC19_7G076400 [Ceratodon purpureus]|uniref:Uncharacterized protein n=1 Tax=Ceratodon purpureus TaxID=3225 RepID=A0A8T0H3F3_CERPU|nr:hypothetical protein KC19_7G076400 [Ceratodon purpureus]
MERKLSVIEPMPPEPFFTKFKDIVKYDDMWYDDPIEGEEAIAAAQALQHKIEEKSIPIRSWLEKNIVPLLMQALNALVAKRPSTIKAQCEFISDHLLKYNPLKDTYPDEYAPKPKGPEPPCGFTIPEEIFDEEGQSLSVDYNPCGCDKGVPIKEEPVKEAAAPPATAAQTAKKDAIAADAMKNPAAHDAVRASVLARAKSGSIKK